MIESMTKSNDINDSSDSIIKSQDMQTDITFPEPQTDQFDITFPEMPLKEESTTKEVTMQEVSAPDVKSPKISYQELQVPNTTALEIP